MMMVPSPRELGIQRLAGAIGAVAANDDPATIDSEVLTGAVLEHGVVFFRSQGTAGKSLVEIGSKLGRLTAGHPIYPPSAGREHVRTFDSKNEARANHWHTDLTFLHRPPRFAVLRAEVVPEVGGDTIWSSTTAAYETLEPNLVPLAESLRIEHSNDSDYVDATVVRDPAGYKRDPFIAEHPAVVRIPESSRPALWIGGFARRVVGFDPEQGRRLLALLQAHVVRPEHTVRWRWEAGDIAIWDNWSTQHYAVLDYGSAHRRFERVTVAGTVPCGVDGRVSQAIAGDTLHYDDPDVSLEY